MRVCLSFVYVCLSASPVVYIYMGVSLVFYISLSILLICLSSYIYLCLSVCQSLQLRLFTSCFFSSSITFYNFFTCSYPFNSSPSFEMCTDTTHRSACTPRRVLSLLPRVVQTMTFLPPSPPFSSSPRAPYLPLPFPQSPLTPPLPSAPPPPACTQSIESS